MADSDALIPDEEAITPKVLQTPRAAGFAGILFAVLFGLTVVLLRKVVPSNPYTAGAWLTRASDRRELTFALSLVPFCGIFFLWFMGAVRALITDGGGTNIFASLEQSWTSVSWEQVVAADPQCIIINNYGTPTAAQKEKFLESSKITQNLTAVKNRCFLPLNYDEVTPGPRNAEAIVKIAKWLHPSAYGLPADGS